MLSVNQLTIDLIKSGHRLVNNLSFTLNEGDKIAIIGHEGTGKSTLIKLLSSHTDLSHAEYFGTILKQGTSGYLDQDTKALWRDTLTHDFFIRDNPQDPPNTNRYESLKRLPKVLAKMDFPMERFDDDKRIGEYSGGEVIKLALAKLLIEEHDMLFLDEPSNDLDFETVVFLEQFIKNSSTPIVYISHDERLLENTANAIIHLQRIKKRTDALSHFERLSYSEYRHQRLSEYQSKLMQAKKERSDYKKKMEKFRQIYQKVEHLQNETVRNPSAARLLKKKIRHLKSMEGRFEKEKTQFTEIPEAEESIDIRFDSVDFPKGKVLLDLKLPKLLRNGMVLSEKVNLTLKGPVKIAIVGRNGIGKTTLLEMIHRTLKADASMRVGLMPQDYMESNDNRDVLTFFGASTDRKKEADVRKVLGALAFEREEMLKQVKNLSGGQKAKLHLLRMIMDRCNVLLLDEPTRNLSPLSLPKVREVLDVYNGAIIAITHDRIFIEEVFDSIYLLDEKGLHPLDAL